MNLIKLAEETKDRDTVPRVVETVGGGLIGAASLGAATGTEKMYHGTSLENAEKIKQEGLLASMGGSGKAKDIGFGDYVENSKGYVHGTKIKAIAKNYAKMNDPEIMEEMKGLNPIRQRMHELEKAKDMMPLDQWKREYRAVVSEYNQASNQLVKNVEGKSLKGVGEILTGRIPYQIIKDAEIDTDAGASKMVAFKTRQDIPREAIYGSDAKLAERAKYYGKNFAHYVTEHPKRFLTGAGALTAGGLLVGDGLLRNEEVPLGSFAKLASSKWNNMVMDVQLVNAGILKVASTDYNERMIQTKMRRTGCSREEAERTMDIADSQYLSEVFMDDFVKKLGGKK
jgi:hypothetical protein